MSTIEEQVDHIADAIARKRGAGPLNLMPDAAASQYRAMARAALVAAADSLDETLAGFAQGGRHTRAKWAVAWLRLLAEREEGR